MDTYSYAKDKTVIMQNVDDVSEVAVVNSECSSCLFGCPSACNILAPTGQIFIKFDYSEFFENLSKNSSVIKIVQI
jgi:hypothetical protein